ncbi:IMPACT family protein [Rubrivirga sp.]|uniref:IMPACT family protein n=1 Tax=Rubrivirga sp. TaxID=1885344 RepID=UPI003B528058
MPPPDSYRTLAAPSQAEPPKTKGSRFIGDAFRARSADEALAHVEAVRAREHAARHHGWAYRLGPDAPAPRSSDDGEPSGSTGPPILREIEARELYRVVVVVTRYYGGTKLGVGGLARAVGEAAGAALDAARKQVVTVRVPVRLAFAFEDTSPAMRLLDVFDAEVADQSHSAEGTELALRVRRSEAEPLRAAFVEATAGRGRVIG